MANTLKLLIIALLAVTVTGCKKDETPALQKTKAELLMGKWQVEKIHDLQNEDSTDECTKKTTFEFLANNVMRWTEWSVRDGVCSPLSYHEGGSVTYHIENDRMTIRMVSADGHATFDKLAFNVSESSFSIHLFEGHKGLFFKKTP